MGVPYEDYRARDAWARRIDRVRSLRHESTDAERVLWSRLRSRHIGGFKFRRQHEFGGCVLDLYCAEARLAVEVDGGQHVSSEGAARDAERTQVLAANGIRVLRFTNTQVLGQLDAVLEAVLRELTET